MRPLFVAAALVLAGCSFHVAYYVRDVKAAPGGGVQVERCEMTQELLFGWGKVAGGGECKWTAATDGGAP